MVSPQQATRFPCSRIAAGLFSIFLVSQAQAISPEELAKKVDELAAQNAALQARVDKLEAALKQQSATAAPQPQAAQEVQLPAKTAAAAPAPSAPAQESTSSTTVGSYGEIGYSRPSKAPQEAYVSVGRAVILIGHQFDEATRMYGEFEWENAVTSASDAGEAEVEQLWVQHDFKNGLSAIAGLYLMPAGLINQNHEPTAYYGVFRPDVDTKIIPSTWREVGLGLSGRTDVGLSWEAGITTDQNLSKWDPASDEGAARGPLQAIHQEGQFATARDLAVHGSVNWRGPGYLLGASAFTGNIGQRTPGFLGNDSRVLLWELHGRYEISGWDLAAEYARGTISHTEALNASFLASVANPTLVPSLFYGGYGQIAYRFWQGRYFRLTPFVRYEIFNTAADFGALSAAQGGVVRPDEHLWTVGTSFFIGEGVVLKADYRHYRNDQFPSAIPPAYTKGNSLNFGIGYSF
jgi:hypothetical protein